MPASSSGPKSLYSIDHDSPINLMYFIETIELELGIEAKKNFRGIQADDLYQTYADTQDLFKATVYIPKVSVKRGMAKLVSWYKEFYKI